MSDITNQFLDQYQQKLEQDPYAVGIQLVLMVCASIATIIAFSLLRPKNKIVYAPKFKYSTEDKRPPSVDDGFFSWIKPLRTTKEPALIKEIGLDGAIFLRFLRMGRWMFTFIALLTCGVLIPVNVIYNIKNPAKGQANRAPLVMISIQNVHGTALWAHVAITYLIAFVVFFFIWVNYKQVVQIRRDYFRSKEYQMSLHARSIMITGISKRYQSDDGLKTLLSGLSIPYPTTSVQIGRRVGTLPDQIERHNDTVKDLEQVLTTYLKNPNKLPAKRPTKRIKSTMGCGGEKVDAIDYLTSKIKRIENAVQGTREHISDRKAENYGFASFSSVPYAHVVAWVLESKKAKGASFALAPLPADIIWKNLTRSEASKVMPRILIAIFLVVFCIIYAIPLIAVSFFANLSAVSVYVPFLDNWSNSDTWKWLFLVTQGVLPPLLAVTLQLLLPMVMRALTRRQGLTTKTGVDRAVCRRYFLFLFIVQFIIFSLIGVGFTVVTNLIIAIGRKGISLQVLLDQLHALPKAIDQAYISQSNYWLTWFPLRAFSAVFDLAQIINLLLAWTRTKLFGRTPRDIREWTKPPTFDYAVYIANALLMMAVAFVYAPLAPLISLFAAVAFFASSFIYKYQLMFVSVTKVESGGRMWRIIVNRILLCLLAQQALITLTIGLQQGWIRSIACTPPAVMVIIFKIILSRKFDSQYDWFMPTDQEVAEAIIHTSDERKNRLEKRFGHPSLHEKLFTPMIHKKSQHLLAEVYSGTMDDDMDIKKDTSAAATGGIQFKAIAETELEADRDAYLREQQAEEDRWETSTVASGFTERTAYTPFAVPGEPEPGYFLAKRAEYMQKGPSTSPPLSTPSTIFPPYPPNDSRENLMYSENNFYPEARRDSRSLSPQDRHYANQPYHDRLQGYVSPQNYSQAQFQYPPPASPPQLQGPRRPSDQSRRQSDMSSQGSRASPAMAGYYDPYGSWRGPNGSPGRSPR